MVVYPLLAALLGDQQTCCGFETTDIPEEQQTEKETETETEQQGKEKEKRPDGEQDQRRHNMEETDAGAETRKDEDGAIQGNERGATFFSQEWRRHVKDAWEGKVREQKAFAAI